MTQKLVKDYMSAAAHSVGADQTLAVAHSMMRKYGIRHLPVLSGGRIVGVLSDRDLRFIEAFEDVDPERVKVDQAMSMDVYAVEPETPLREVAAKMAAEKFGSAVVLRGREVAGVVTTTDLCRALAEALAP